jgi:predicted metalloprotease with PDZ domain
MKLRSVFAAAVLGFNAFAQTTAPILVSIDLDKTDNDRVAVTMTVPKMAGNTAVFRIPKTVPGTYSTDNYGRFVEDVKAFDTKGGVLAVTKEGDNGWNITGANDLAKVTYYVNDTYDIEDKHDVFSPAGTNILEGKNFLLNLHGFVGYFEPLLQTPYEVSISHPATLWGATAMDDTDASDAKDLFKVSRYAELVDNPIMYAEPNYTTFTVDDMQIIFSVYSPNKAFDVKDLSPGIEKMMRAQKKFLGPINKNKRYAVLLYLTDMSKPDAQGFGALEHNSSTTVVFPEMMPKDQLVGGLTDVVSHEFFHIVTPLTVHATQIHDFDFTNPKMSEHLWMYEGVTEYFANLFQVNQGLIPEDEFYDRMAQKISNASKMNDRMPFTKMSANVLQQPYKAQYLNVYEKGALIGMCIDIIIREKSDGERGILDLMAKLSKEYGPTKPFQDKDLFPKIVSLTYPEVGEFLNTYVAGETPIPYDKFFAKMGVTMAKKQVPENVFLKGQTPFITIKPGTKQIVVLNGIKPNAFLKSLDLKGGDVITHVNGKAYDLDNIYDLVMSSTTWKEDDEVTVQIVRDGENKTVKGKVKLEYTETEGWTFTDKTKEKLKESWLKG